MTGDRPAPVGMPHTRSSLAVDLRDLGVRPGGTLLVHATLRSVGRVLGDSRAVVEALLDVLGPDGTLVVPTHTPHNTDPASWINPPVFERHWPAIREQMPPFDPVISPSRWMGALAEQVRTWPGAMRSNHPQVSFAALGPAAEAIVGGHARTAMLGETSPLARLYERDADVLLLGAGHGSNTSLHLAEYRQPAPPTERVGSAVRAAGGGQEFVWWTDVVLDESDFERLGAEFDGTGAVRTGRVGNAACRLMRQRAAVDFAVDWITRNR
ncbi:aminoglycoside N(3)-acetyltransferase [Plantactinospora sp. GCM10030261]|uniref:aminoglycoside N(3)-acetyltransferase n=1 Tax=Plantactinospora sp. GCM10030261 TaxID=3273420 RepID=UPI00361B6AFC